VTCHAVTCHAIHFSIWKLPFDDKLSYVNAVRQYSRTCPYFAFPRVFKSDSAVDGQGTQGEAGRESKRSKWQRKSWKVDGYKREADRCNRARKIGMGG
jgi:hypothetical protein